MITAENCNTIFRTCIKQYHIHDNVDQALDNPFSAGEINHLLFHKCWIDTVQWHFEDLIRDPEIDPIEGMKLKRLIDASNQRRTDMVEQIDDWFLVAFEDVNGEQQHTYNIVTRPPSIQLSSFSESVPLILSLENSKKWLSDSVTDALSLLKDTLETQFGFYPVSSIVNNIEINKPEMILESQPADQYGNYSLFD